MKKILVIDNQDSFVYNLVEMLRVADVPFIVIKSDELRFPLNTDQIAGILLSPGGGLPEEYPLMMELIDRYHQQIPFLGVCLGHQAIAQYFKGTLLQLPKPLHGHASELRLTPHSDLLLKGLTIPSVIGRYHSWVVNKTNLPQSLINLAVDEDDNIMVLRHASLPIWGVQFHPESVITDKCGMMILKNWLSVCMPEEQSVQK